MKRSIILLNILILILFSCNKEDIQLLEITIIEFDENQTFYQRDTVTLKYELSNYELDSICLFSQDVLIKTQQFPQNEFIFIADSIGSIKITLTAFKKGNILDSEIRNINVYKTSNNVSLVLNCSTLEGDKNYFVGDQLKIYVEPKYENGWLQITKYKEVTFHLNGKSLGTKYSLPFVFETGIIDETENTVELTMVDKDNHIYIEELQLIVPVNTPPEIEIEYKYKYGVKPGYFYSFEPIIFNTNGSDNINIHYIEYYINDNLYLTDTVNSNRLYYHEFNAGILSSGEHTSYCIAYDDKGASTKSETLHFIIYGAIQVNQNLVDVEKTSNANVVYAISNSTLFKINPVNENIEQQFTLPFQDATCIKYVNEQQKLYIGYQDGSLICFNEQSKTFTTILSTSIPNITDLEIDNLLDRAIIISNEKIILFNLSDDSIIDEFSNTQAINSLAIDKQNKIIIATANPHSTGGYIYKLNYNASSITLEKSKYGISFPLRVLFKNNNEVFTVLTNSSYAFSSYYSENLTTAGIYSLNYRVGTACYSSDGNDFYMDNDFESLIDYCNTSDYSKYQTSYIPLEGYNDVEFLTTNSDDSKLIIFTDDIVDKTDVKIFFINL